MNRLNRWAYERHDLIASLITLICSTSKAWWVIEITVGVSALILGWPGWALCAAIAAITRLTRIKPNLTLAVYELLIWTWPLFALAEINGLFDTPVPVTTPLGDICYLIALSYLLADLFQPPRKRRKVKVVPAAKPVYQEMIT